MATPPSLQLPHVDHVSPPPGSVPATSLPLTVFDVLWIGHPPIQRLFFYELNTTTADFLNSLFPKIKHALSLSLQLFFSLAGKIHGNHEIRYVDGDSVSLTVAESDGDFQILASNNQKCATEVCPFLPQLPSPSLLALQFTIFPGAGMAIGISINHVVADGRSMAHFMKSWASICRAGKDDTSIIQPPCYDRTMLEAHDWLKPVILKKIADAALEHSAKASYSQIPTPDLRATFVLSPANIDLLRRRVLVEVEEREKPFHCSTFVLTCSYVWICLIKSRGEVLGDRVEHFAFAADSRYRLDPPLPAQYFGNCLSGCCAAVKRSDLVSEQGLLAATKALRKGIQVLKEVGPVKVIENFFGRSKEILKQRPVSVAGSPQFRVYDIDFGWGRPKKTEVTSIDVAGAMYIGDSRDEEGGVEIGLSLSEQEMGSFVFLFQKGLAETDHSR